MADQGNILPKKETSGQLRASPTELRSGEVQEILSSVPNWMIRWGSCLILVLIILTVYLSWLIKYPEVVQGNAILTTVEQPIRIYSKSSGYVSKILVKNESFVAEGELISQMHSSVSKSNIDSLSSLLADFNYSNYKHLLDFLEQSKPLGQSQTAANELYYHLRDYSKLINDQLYKTRLKTLEQKINYNGRLAWIAKQEIDLHKVELSQAKEKFKADSILYVKKVIPKHTFYKNRSEFIATQQKIFNSKKSYVQYKIAASELIKEKEEVLKNFDIQKNNLETKIKTSINSINNVLNSWQESYLIEAPISGKLTYLDNLAENEFVHTSTPLFAIIPQNDNVVAVVKTQGADYGKIKQGQKVRLKMENFPSQEYGQLIGKIKSFSPLAGEEGYIVKVELDDGLKTTYKKSLQYSPEMKGKAEIVTADLRLIERILYSIRKIIDRK